MICNILAQKKQYGRGILPQFQLSMKYLTTVIAACLVALPSTTEAQTTDGETSQDITYSEVINVGDQTVSRNIPGDTKFGPSNQTVGIWVNGGQFSDDTTSNSVTIYSDAVFQIGGDKLYDKTIPQETSVVSQGGSIKLGQTYTYSYNNDEGPSLSVLVLGSSDKASVFSAESFTAGSSSGKTVNIYIDGRNNKFETAFRAGSFTLARKNPAIQSEGLHFSLKNLASFTTDGDAYFYLTDPNDSFIVENNSIPNSNNDLEGDQIKRGIFVGQDFYLYNSAPLSIHSSAAERALIKNTNVVVGGGFVLAGDSHYSTVGKSTFLKVINDADVNASISASTVLVFSDVPGNTTTLLLGHGSKVNASQYIYVHSEESSSSVLMIGDTTSREADYGISAPYVAMGGRGSSKIIFNNAHNGDTAEEASFSIQGHGDVDLQSGRTIFSKDSSYWGNTNISDGSALILKTASSAGTSDISNSGELRFSGVQGTIQNNISGSGTVVFEDDANVSVLDNAAWTGPTNINKASVSLGASDSPTHMSSSIVNISQEGKLNGFGSINGSLNNAGFFMIGDDENASPTNFNIGRNIVNSGEIHLGNGKSVGSSLIVHGNYTGNNGLLAFNTVLNGDNDSPTDKLVVEGDTAGNTKVRVNALGGSGKQTNTGIELIHVDGASEGSFRQEGRIVAGAYDYNLERGTGDNNKNWYLKSHPTKPKGQHGRTGSDDSSSPLDQDSTPLYRPEAGAYVGNSAVVQTLFSSRLHDRIGDLWYADPYAENNQLTGMWVKQRGNYNTWRESSGQTRNRTQMYATQLGADVASWTSNGENRFLVGWVAGYGHGRTKSRSIHTGYHAIGTVDGLNVGVTGTWYQDGLHHQGIYVDTWLTYGWFDNKVKGQGIETEKYHSRGFTGSLETGYTWKLGEHVTEKGCDIGWFLQPQAQMIWSGVKTDTFHEHNGTTVKSRGRNNIQTRLGARLMLDTNLRSYANGIGGTQFFIEGNWVHNTKSHGVEMNGTVLNQEGARHLGEIKVGLNGKPTDNLHVWTNVTVRAGTHHYRDLTGMIGLKYSF